jgi:predicted metal-dependent phosphoesterase TrpH
MTPDPGLAFIDLHCHTSASFDSLADPLAVVRAAAGRGLTHLAITDHDRIDGALRARDSAPDGLTVIVGEEIKTDAGDLIAVFLERAVPPGLPVAEAIAAVREQGGLVGVPHPFDRLRGSMGRNEALEGLAGLVDWVEAYNARVLGGSGNEQAALFARAHGLPGIAVSDAHSILEVGVAYTALTGDPSTAPGLLAALPSAQLVAGRATYFARLLTPIAKVVQQARGHGRVEPGAAADAGQRERER